MPETLPGFSGGRLPVRTKVEKGRDDEDEGRRTEKDR